ncbi:hypothetical protein [Kitasatospora sp. NPDC089509]|uniref:hypothetical protein n=1 Tax=Kitasatospora sp. NPDC089509 TaxID=3364079 RepID=UPI003816B617
MISNAISSGTVVGAAVQAGTINGGITLYNPPSRPVPRQLPRHRALVDRHDDTARLAALLDAEDPRPVLITGPPGIGTTMLALHLLHQRDTPPGGQLYADLGAHSTTGPARPEDVTARWLRALGITTPPPDLEEASALLRSLTTDRAVAVLLDNAACDEQVRALLPAGRSLVVVTSRTPLTGLLAEGAHHHRLGALPPEAARELLAATAGQAGEGQDLDALAAPCRGVPLALTLTGARLAAGHTIPTAPAADLPLDDLVTHALDQAYDALDDPAARFYRDLGTQPLPGASVDAAMAGAVSRTDPAATAEHIATLTQSGLLLDVDAGEGLFRFALSDGRLHAAALARRTDTAEQTDAGRRRALDWLLAEAFAASRAAHPFRHHAEPRLLYPPPHRAALTTPEQGLAWLRTRGPYLRTALEVADAHGLDDITAHLAHAYWPWLLRERNYPLWTATYDLAVPAATRLTTTAPGPASRWLLADLLGARSNVRRATGDYSGATDDRRAALTIATEDHDREGQAQHLQGLGRVALAAGEHGLARVYLTEALRRCAELGTGRDTGVIRVALAVALHTTGANDAALAHLRLAHEELRACGDDLNAGRALAWKGRVLAQSGEHRLAAHDLASAHNLFIAQHAHAWQGRVLLWTAESQGDQGHTDTAADLLRRARDLCADSPADLADIATAAKRLGVDL